MVKLESLVLLQIVEVKYQFGHLNNDLPQKLAFNWWLTYQYKKEDELKEQLD